MEGPLPSSDATMNPVKEMCNMSTDSSLDVRHVSPRERHLLVFSTFESLKPGEGFILIGVTILSRSALNFRPGA